MLHAYILYYLMLAVTELVKITVYLRQADILVKMVFQVFNRGSLALPDIERRAFTSFPEYVIPMRLNPTLSKTRSRIRSAPSMVMFEMQDKASVPHFSSSALASGAFFSEQIQTRMAALILALYPFTTFLHKFFDFFFVLSNPNGSQLRISS